MKDLKFKIIYSMYDYIKRNKVRNNLFLNKLLKNVNKVIKENPNIVDAIPENKLNDEILLIASLNGYIINENTSDKIKNNINLVKNIINNTDSFFLISCVQLYD